MMKSSHTAKEIETKTLLVVDFLDLYVPFYGLDSVILAIKFSFHGSFLAFSYKLEVLNMALC